MSETYLFKIETKYSSTGCMITENYFKESKYIDRILEHRRVDLFLNGEQCTIFKFGIHDYCLLETIEVEIG